MNDFKDFWNSPEETPALLPGSSQPLPSIAAATRADLISSVTQIVTESSLFMTGSFNQQAEVEKFSDEVSSYATSNEVISLLSHTVGKPRVSESEKEFVERASNLLREILRKHFNL